MLPLPPSSFGFQIPGPVAGNDQFAARQVQDNYNQDKLRRFRGTMIRMRRKALLSDDPHQLASYLELSRALNMDPSISATGRADDRHARAENQFNQNTQAAQLFQAPAFPSPITWLN